MGHKFVLLVVVIMAISYGDGTAIVPEGEGFNKHNMLDAWITALTDSKLSVATKAKIKQLLINHGHKFIETDAKEYATEDNRNWCCKELIESSKVVYATKIGYQTKTATSSSKSCRSGFFFIGGGCSTINRVITYLDYYTYIDQSDYEKIDLGYEPCREDYITCCVDFFYFKPLDQCCSFDDWKELVLIFIEYGHLDVWTQSVNN